MPIVLPTVVESLGSGSVLKVLKGTGSSAPSGVDAVLAYNSLVMNNRKWLDSIIVTGIDGLADPDIRDERANNPSADGETAFDSFYGGRTIVLKGYIRAFTLDKLRDIEQGLKTAFMPLKEMPLQIQGKTLETTVQIWCKKNASMAWSEDQQRDDYFKREFMITLRASNPRFFSLEEELRQEIFGAIDPFNSDSITAKLYKFLEGSGTLKVEEGKLKPTSTAVKVLTLIEPETFQPRPAAQIDYTPKSAFTSSVMAARIKYIDATNYLNVSISSTGAVSFQKFTSEIPGFPVALTPTYVKGGTPIARSLETTYRFKVEMVGEKIYLYHGTSSEWTTVAYYELSFAEQEIFGSDIYARPYLHLRPGNVAWEFDNIVFGPGSMEDQQVMTVVNRGNKEAQPRYELSGPISNPKIHNADTDEWLLFKAGTEIKAGELWVADIKENTLVDQEGNNKFGRLDPISDWPELIEGENHLRLSGEAMAPQLIGASMYRPGLSVRYKHSWY